MYSIQIRTFFKLEYLLVSYSEKAPGVNQTLCNEHFRLCFALPICINQHLQFSCEINKRSSWGAAQSRCLGHCFITEDRLKSKVCLLCLGNLQRQQKTFTLWPWKPAALKISTLWCHRRHWSARSEFFYLSSRFCSLPQNMLPCFWKKQEENTSGTKCSASWRGAGSIIVWGCNLGGGWDRDLWCCRRVEAEGFIPHEIRAQSWNSSSLHCATTYFSFWPLTNLSVILLWIISPLVDMFSLSIPKCNLTNI